MFINKFAINEQNLIFIESINFNCSLELASTTN